MDDPVGNEVDAEGHRDIRSLFDLSGRVALVTGGSRGLGLAMAEGLAEAGAMVAVAARRREWLDQAVATLRRHGRPCIGVELDIADGDRVETAVDEVLSAFGRVDVLVNAAATIWGAPPLETPVEQWRRVLEVNVTGTYLVTRRVARHMVAAGGGSIINVVSVHGLLGQPPELTALSYTTSKGALVNFTRDLAVKLAPHGVRVNAIAPGIFQTRMTAAVIARHGPELLRWVPLRRFGRDGELKGAVVYLASDASSYVTGHVLAVDGGWTAW